jgi:hypothetical protein
MTSGNQPNRYAPMTAASYMVFDESALLARIGNDLRDLYGDVEDSSLPGDLLHLANLIDGKRRHASEDGAAS